ncbi:lysophospholipid acyltransferase family protein [Pannus brasiliensis CCIBt3594]|uniref:Lysophospholipid acyltransferase family protein n=1 Tax=Pannus brasiliensis CCIBt3594 TaxID=1427578 RepID=A0AAW9QS79_9CHRO
MTLLTPLSASRLLLDSTRTGLYTEGRQNIPSEGVAIVVSNHRSFLDAPILIQALGRTVHIACHHYMGQTPLLREVVNELGCFPFDVPEKRHATFFDRATDYLKSDRWIGLFPEGGSPMIHLTGPREVGTFHRGFAHLALRCPVERISVVPVAIVSESESVFTAFPVRLLRLFDPSEPLFDRPDWHPVVVYHRVRACIGRPYRVSDLDRQEYRGKQGKRVIERVIAHCRDEITGLLEKG